jgi:hypothetical protein
MLLGLVPRTLVPPRDDALAPAWRIMALLVPELRGNHEARHGDDDADLLPLQRVSAGAHGGIGTYADARPRVDGGRASRARHRGLSSDHPGVPHEIDGGVEVWRLRDGVHRPGKTLVRHRLFRTVALGARRQIDLVEAPGGKAPSRSGRALPVL